MDKITDQEVELLKSRLVGQNFKNLLSHKHVTKYALARDCNIRYQTLCNWQASRYRPSAALAIRVGLYLGLLKPSSSRLLALKGEIRKLEAEASRLESTPGRR
jgi:DNA-binding XRE family transcriptional regulator